MVKPAREDIHSEWEAGEVEGELQDGPHVREHRGMQP
jgi:hypothetical protein